MWKPSAVVEARAEVAEVVEVEAMAAVMEEAQKSIPEVAEELSIERHR
jgi:hypothetical protein